MTDLNILVCRTEPSRELRSMLRHLVEMMPASSVSGPGRDSAINLLVKQVPRKSQRNPDNSLTLWVIDQGKIQTNFLTLYGRDQGMVETEHVVFSSLVDAAILSCR